MESSPNCKHSRFAWSFATIVLVPRGQRQQRLKDLEVVLALQRIAALGFGGVELSARWLDFHALSREDASNFRAQAETLGLAFSGINMDRCLISRKHPQNIEVLRSALDKATHLGISLISFALSADMEGRDQRPLLRATDFSADDVSYAAAEIKQLARTARDKGVRLSVELHDDGMLDDPESCLNFLGKVDESNVGVNPDVGNLCREPGKTGDWNRAIRQLSPCANCWHLKNYRNAQPAALDDGDVDFAECFRTMAENGYQGWVSSESRWGGNPWDTQAKDLQFMKHAANGRPQ